jgi:hypothetical protein
MFVRLERECHRLYVYLAQAQRVKGRPHRFRLGGLGSILACEPLSVIERIRFWAQFDARLDGLRARHPSRISEADAAEIRAMTARRIPPPCTEDELRLLARAILQRDVMAAFDLGADAMAEAARRLTALARELKGQTRQSQAKEAAE